MWRESSGAAEQPDLWPRTTTGPHFRKNMLMSGTSQIILDPIWSVTWFTHVTSLQCKRSFFNSRNSQFVIKLIKYETVKIEPTVTSNVVSIHAHRNQNWNLVEPVVFLLLSFLDLRSFLTVPFKYLRTCFTVVHCSKNTVTVCWQQSQVGSCTCSETDYGCQLPLCIFWIFSVFSIIFSASSV